MRQTTKAHRACHAHQILSIKSDYFPKEEKEKEEKERTEFAKDQTASLNVKSASRNDFVALKFL